MSEEVETSLRARPYYEPEQHTLGVELLLDGQVFAVIGLGEATAFGAELIRMAAYAENECQLDLGYEMLGNDLDKRKLLLSMFKTSRRVYFRELTGEITLGGDPDALSSEQEDHQDGRQQA
jgi:hypothetical protein